MLELLWRGVAILYTSESEKRIALDLRKALTSYGTPSTIYKLGEADLSSLWHCYDAFVFVSPIGVATRIVCPNLKHKSVDPPILVVDPGGRYVIPILGGHWGANEIAYDFSNLLNLKPIITTAAELHGITAVEYLARLLHCDIENTDAIVDFNTALLNGEEVCVYGVDNLPGSVRGSYVVGSTSCRYVFVVVKSGIEEVGGELSGKKVLICRQYKISIGLGLHSDIDVEEASEKILLLINKLGFDLSQIVCIASTKRLAERISERLRVGFRYVKDEEIEGLHDKCFTPPTEKLVVYGVKGVAEPCAIVGCGGRGKVIYRKNSIGNSMTIAIAACR